ncbi:PSD1 and planctomycete cytochrome C domain-containing protein [Stieleria varia]|uniref:Planctomycete cytochrome C n=1 Tax=Stieleria varia TaxID=2528005 RepID=A0A5C6AXA5_9BACT|nr:PSD1 and planctomycete cytochrome C domain-containing protein [Stieleria varia]TWU02754.1 Planctomycete cytochrome C [Stieleria varia]
MPTSISHLLLFLWIPLLGLLTGHAHAEGIDFVRDIRPILSENCSFCHGPDEATREADLRLDTADGVATVIDKTSAASELYRRLITEDPDERMPPPESNRKLTPEQIELLRRWMDDGAKWEQHWSFRPITSPPIPRVDPNPVAPIRNPIDAFVQSKLAEHDLTPSPEAPRATLIRRLSLDLTGLPPTPDQVDEFLADNDPDAYARLVDRLLDSPAYGQRMAWDWLDAARYADTNGYQGDNERTMWPWRDWVVNAFNDNMPYDQFTIWQLAGDLLPDATHEQRLATGFCRNHMINGEGGRIAEENRVEYVMDMSETMGTVWLGLTLNCCRCHDHKYDPVTNAEYYQLFAYFNQTPVNGGGGDAQMAPNLPTPSAEQRKQLADVNEQIAALDQSIQTLTKSLAAQQAKWEQGELARLTATTQWHPLHPEKVFANHTQTRTLPDDSVLTSGPAADNDTYMVIAKTDLRRVTAVRLEALRHPSMTEGSLSKADSGNFVLTGIEVSVVESESDEAPVHPFATAEATFEQGDLKATKAFDGNPKTGWAVYEGRIVDREHEAVFRFKEPLIPTADKQIKIVLRHDSVHQRHNLGRFRLSLTDHAEPRLGEVTDQLLTALRVAPDDRSAEQRTLVSDAYRDSNPEFKSLQDERAKLVERRGKIEKSFPKVMVMADMSKPRETFILERGLYNKPKEPVTAELPAFLPTPEQSTEVNDRLSLARWLVDSQNPLTARVTVNRFWQQVFGIGLVKTTEDFGAQGEIPVHMDLLNWLSDQFRQDGWNVKNLMRLIVTSHTYRQSSKITDQDVYQRDPDNRLLARGSRYRLPSWMIRDQALAISGLLSPQQGGPAVNTYQPAGIWEEASFGKKVYRRDSGSQLYRRSLYTFWRRIIAPTMFFDNATRQTCTVKVSRTNTPLHALQTLNNEAYVEAARVLAAGALQSSAATDADRIDWIMKRSVARTAQDAERSILLAGLQRTRQQFKDSPEAAAKLIAIGESPRDESLDTLDHAAWTSLCLAVLNLDETLNRE